MIELNDVKSSRRIVNVEMGVLIVFLFLNFKLKSRLGNNLIHVKPYRLISHTSQNPILLK